VCVCVCVGPKTKYQYDIVRNSEFADAHIKFTFLRYTALLKVIAVYLSY
jgi:hypothetical protein